MDLRDVDRVWMKFTGREDRPGSFGLMDNVGLDVIYDIEMVYYRNTKDPKDQIEKETNEHRTSNVQSSIGGL